MTDFTNRRNFIKGAAAASLMAGVTMSGTRLGSSAVGAQVPSCGGDARSLVCIFLNGGADSMNMFVPYDYSRSGSDYATYARTRGDIAIPRSGLTPVTNGDFAFNSTLGDFARLYDSGDLAVVSNVGPLAGPTTQADVVAGRGLPQSLFAHDAQQRLWQTATTSVGGTAEGWGGRIAQQIETCDPDATIPAAVSALGSSVWQSTATGNYLRLTSSSTLRRMNGFDPAVAGWHSQDQRDRVAAILESALVDSESSERELERLMAQSTRSAIITNAELEDVTADDSIDMGDLRSSRLKSQLHLVAQLINNRERLNMSRQVFFVRLGGWDTHGDQNDRLPVLLEELNSAVAAFQNALGPTQMNLADSVTTFTASDFGRTLTSNGNGTDHGWGGHGFVIGGAVKGGNVYGEIPNFSQTNNPDDIGTGRSFTGRIIPKISVGQYGATLASWAGVPNSNLDEIFTGLKNFDDRNLDFMEAA